LRYEDRLLAGVLKSMSPCTFEQTVNDVSDTLSVMELQHIKMTVGLWAVTAVDRDHNRSVMDWQHRFRRLRLAPTAGHRPFVERSGAHDESAHP
jgi:hypothetical protein